MKPNFILIALMALILISVFPVQAVQTITMADPSSTSPRDILVYNSSGSLIGLYNTTSIITTDPNTSYIFTLKPQYTNPLDDPVTWLNSMLSYLTTHAIEIIVAAFLLGLFFAGSRR